jgi:RNA polymerase sigma-70 factor (ECF subfamily)
MPPADTDLLLDRAGAGDQRAVDALLVRHRPRLRAMVRCRLDRRIASRIDPSDVVQEALLEACRRLPEYLRERPVPFYPWLRALAWERLIHLHQRHIRAKKRSVDREAAFDPILTDDSIAVLASRLCNSESAGPRAALIRAELRHRVQSALDHLSQSDRELMILRYIEQLSIQDIMAILNLKESAVNLRLLRALQRLRKHFGDEGQE